MSILGIRNFMGKRMHWVMIGLSVLMLLSMAAYFGGGRGGPGDGEAGSGMVIATVDGENITAQDLDTALRQMEDRARQGGGGRITADQEFDSRTQAISGLITQVAMRKEASRRGIDIDDDAVIKYFQLQFAEQLQQQKESMIMQKQLKANATDKEFKDALRKQMGRSVDEAIAQQMDQIKQTLSDPNQKEQMYASVAIETLRKKISDAVKVTEADYKRANEQLRLRRIFVESRKHQNAKQRIEDAEKRLKAGEAFEKLADELGDDVVANVPGQKMPKGEMQAMSRSMIEMQPQLKDIAEKGAGYTSGVIDMGYGFAIYKVLEVKDGLPKDYAAKKDTYLKQFKQQKGGTEFQKWAEDFQKKLKADIKVKSWDLLYRYSTEQRAQTAPKPQDVVDINVKYLKAAEVLLKNRASDPYPQNALLLKLRTARMLASTPDYTDIKGKDAAKVAYRGALLECLNTWEDAGSRLSLFQDYLKEKKYKEAVEQLKVISRTAYSLSPQDSSMHFQVTEQIKLLKKAGYDSPDLQRLVAAEDKYALQLREKQLRDAAEQEKMKEAQKKAEERAKADAAKKADKAKPEAPKDNAQPEKGKQ